MEGKPTDGSPRLARRAFLAATGSLVTAGCVSTGRSDGVYTSMRTPSPTRLRRSSGRERSDRTNRAERTGGITPVTVTADDRSVASTARIFAELRVDWAAETRQSIQPANADKYYYAAPPDRKFVVVMFGVQNVTANDNKIALTPRLFELAVPSSDENPTNYRHRELEYLPNPFADVTLRQGSTTAGWMVYSVPRAVRRAELFAVKGLFPDPIEVDFVEESIDVPDM